MVKQPAIWAGDGTTTITQTQAGVQRRVQTNTNVRKTQAGVIRVLQPNNVQPKAPAVWTIQ